MRSLVVFVTVLALSVAAPRDDSSLKKRSVGHAVDYTVPSAVTQTLVADSVVAEPVVETRAVYASPATTIYSTGSAVSHQSRVDVRTSPAVVASAPAVISTPTLVEARSVYSAPVYTVPSAVSHLPRYEVDARSVWTPTVYATSW